MKKTIKLMSLALAVVMAVALFSGCGAAPSTLENAPVPEAPAVAGRIVVSVNPEVAVDYDAKGTVVNVEGLNEDGVYVATQYGDGYEGKETRVVVSEIVDLIYVDGYFETTVDGHDKNIIVKVDQGSELPSDDFVDVIAGDVRVVVSGHNSGSTAVTVGLGDYSFEYSEKGYISLGKAEEIALAQGGALNAGATVIEKEYDVEDGVYEVEYLFGDTKYEYDVDALTGKVVNSSSELISAILGNGAEYPQLGGDHNAYGNQVEDYWEAYGDNWENYGESWENWGESVGDYFDHYFDF